MSVSRSRSSTMEAVRAVLAADCACSEADFLQDGLMVVPAEKRSGRRRFPRPDKPLLMMSMGRGVVISCHPERIAWLRDLLGARSRDAIFWAATIADLQRYVAHDGQTLHGPEQKFVCAPEAFRPAAPPAAVTISSFEGDAVFGLYRHAGFENALSYRPDNPRPDVVAAVARRNGEIVGIAAASADCEAMWQIGVDVVAAARGAGIGRALVSRLTEAVFQCGRVPYYSTNISNVRSSALASSLGYWPAWVELHARDHPPAATP
jgi:GNAT superfamily N-acetyltransferase